MKIYSEICAYAKLLSKNIIYHKYFLQKFVKLVHIKRRASAGTNFQIDIDDMEEK